MESSLPSKQKMWSRWADEDVGMDNNCTLRSVRTEREFSLSQARSLVNILQEIDSNEFAGERESQSIIAGKRSARE